MQTKIYETDRVVVELRSTVGEECRYPMSAENQIWLVREAEGPNGVPVWKDINKIQWPYCHMSALCGEQVIQAEFQDRYVDSKPIKAEDYIGLWRVAKKAAVSLDSLAKMGIKLTAVIVKPLQPVLEEIAQEHNASKRQFLDSMYATRTADRICWVIPLDSLESLETYTLVAGIWVNTQTYPDQVNEIKVSASGTAVRPTVSEYDLFAENEVAA